MRKIFLLLLLTSQLGHAQTTIWKESAPLNASKRLGNIQASQHEIDLKAFHSQFGSHESSPIQISIPFPNGELIPFELLESNILPPELAKKFPNIKTYTGIGPKGQVLRLDKNSNGIRAMIFSEEGTVFLDPEERVGTIYNSYYRHEYQQNKEKYLIEKSIMGSAVANKSIVNRIQKNNYTHRSSGSELKTYRIAIAADNDYVEFHGGTVEGALSAIVTTLNRVTGIFEKELGISFQLVAENDQIIYTTAASDPYDGKDTDGALDTNQSNLDSVIGSDNYDIGHVFTTGSGGLAGLGVVCTSNRKARGTTGVASPIGDPFDIDFVAHEIGHQFGGNHTFNGSQSNCSGGNRNAQTAYEPGSGSTIMAYAGICGSDNIQNSSDAYFHAASLEEILIYTEDNSGSACGTITASGNSQPTVAAPSGGFTIPVSTPFKLTASGSDAEGDSALTFSWEQFDLGPAGAPGSSEGDAPLFRSLTPNTSATRYFPALSSVIAGTNETTEVLPTTTRNMNFRVTARDNATIGGTSSADITFVTASEAGPFLVTSQATEGTIYQGGKVQLIQWNTANTNQAPVNSQSVKISLSIDGGITFNEVLLESTPNDGAAFVAIPNIATTQARIMVEAADNIFFNVNSRNFEIQETTAPDFDLLISDVPANSCEDQITVNVAIVGINGFQDSVALTRDASTENLAFAVSSNLATPGESISITITNEGEAGTKSFNLVGTSGSLANQRMVNLEYLTIPEESPTLSVPTSDQTAVVLNPTFSWNAVTGVNTYNFQLSTDDQFSAITSASSLSATSLALNQTLSPNTTYFWRVNAENACGAGPFATGTFISENESTTNFSATDLPINIVSGSTVFSTISVTSDFLLSDIDVSSIDITHTFISDITVSLMAPSGASIILFDKVCGNNTNFLAGFDDETSTTLSCPPTSGGLFSPANPLSVVDGQSSIGNWTLSITDSFNGDEGTLNNWSLSLKTAAESLWLFSNSSTPTQISLNWSNLASNIGYEVEQGDGSGNFVKIAETTTGVNTLTVPGLTPSTAYSFRVRAITGDSFSNYSNTSPITTLPEVPETPTSLLGTQLSTRSISLEWTDNSDREDGFIIERALSSSENFEEIQRTNANITSFEDNTILAQNSYAYRISSFNVTGASEPSDPLILAVLNTQKPNEEYRVFPNPVSSQLNIFFPENSNPQYITIFDLQGKAVVQKHFEKPDTSTIDISFLNEGLYFLHIREEQSTIVHKIIKKY